MATLTRNEYSGTYWQVVFLLLLCIFGWAWALSGWKTALDGWQSSSSSSSPILHPNALDPCYPNYSVQGKIPDSLINVSAGYSGGLWKCSDGRILGCNLFATTLYCDEIKNITYGTSIITSYLNVSDVSETHLTETSICSEGQHLESCNNDPDFINKTCNKDRSICQMVACIKCVADERPKKEG